MRVLPATFIGEVITRAFGDIYDFIKTNVVDEAIRFVSYHFKETGYTEEEYEKIVKVKILDYEFDPPIAF